MRIGEIRKQVSVQAEMPTPDGAGGYALVWITLATVWADIKPASGSKVFAAQHLEGHVTHRITLRYRGDAPITTDMRIVYGSRAFNIRAVLNTDERNQWWEVLAEEGAAL